MAKRNNRIDTEVIALAVTGLSQRAIAEKLSISQAAVSKILQDNKNKQKLKYGKTPNKKKTVNRLFCLD